MMDSFGARSTLQVGGRAYEMYRLDALAKEGYNLQRLPYSLKIVLENLLRTEDGKTVNADDIRYLAQWQPRAIPDHETAPGVRTRALPRAGYCEE